VIWVNQIVQGVLLGGFYALLATGLSLMFGVMRIINLAHGDLAIVGAFLVWWLHDRGLSVGVSLVIMLPLLAAVGLVLQRVLLERSLRAGVLMPLLTTFGLAIVIQNLLFEKFGADIRSVDIGSLAFDGWKVTDQIYVGKLPVLIFGVALALLAALQFFLSRLPLGRAMRATAQDPETAELVGINARGVYLCAAAIAVATAGLAGAFLAMRATFDAYAGPTLLIFAFEAVVIGRIGSLWGTLVGGVSIGVAQTIGAQLNPQWSILAGHLVFLAVLAARLAAGGVWARGGFRAALGMRS
jgi:branched-chain amino acid transport system permease protein